MGIFDTGFNLNPNLGSIPLQKSFADMGDFGNIASKDALDFVHANPAAGTGVTPSFWDNDFWKSAFGSTDANGIKTNGWGGAALGLLQGGLGAFMGMKQYGLAKDALAQSKKQFNLNYAAQKQTTNAALEDRQDARIASREGASNPYDSTADYMSKYGIK